ncbi:MAG: cation diffusion facilitator family transporter [Candidatus Hadarchaeota archaeon]
MLHRFTGRGYAGTRRALMLAFSVVVVVMVAEIVGGLLSNSLALIGDSAHMFMDALALGMSIAALRFATREPTTRRTYGFYRLEIMAALANGILLVLVSSFVFLEAYHRLIGPPEVRGGLMLAVAFIGLVANLIAIYFMRHIKEESLNVKGAFLHVIGDTISSMGVIVSALVILLTGYFLVDSLMGIFIGAIILRGAIGLIWESSSVLLESTPKGIDAGEVIKEIKKVDGVIEVHDFHFWSISTGINAMSTHVMIENQMVSKAGAILDEITSKLRKFDIFHTTIQLECKTCKDPFICSLVKNKGH